MMKGVGSFWSGEVLPGRWVELDSNTNVYQVGKNKDREHLAILLLLSGIN